MGALHGKRKLTRRGHDIKQVTIGRLPRKRFRVTILSTQSTGSQLVSSRSYTPCGKGRPKTRRRR